MLQPITLLNTSGHQPIDNIIRGLIGIFEAAFPERIRAYYLAGSYADGSAVPSSDIDIRVVFKGGFHGEEEVARVRRVRDDCRLLSPVDIDLPPLSEERLLHDADWAHETISIKLAGVPLYGEDIRASLQLPSFEQYTRNITAAPIQFFARLHGGLPLIFPLAYPDLQGDFYGYEEVDQGGEHSTKMLVHIVGFAASCIVALRAKRMVTKKSDWLAAYKQSIGDEWAAFLETTYTKGKLVWRYRIPDSDSEKKILRDLCHETLTFENHFLALYHDYLLELLGGDDPGAQLFAVKRLKDVVYPDSQIRSALKALEAAGEETRTAVDETLRVYTTALAEFTITQGQSI
jgi:predicted nucleotidyltransferase